MPSYDYVCTQCRHPFTARHGMTEPAPGCPHCGGAVERAFLVAPAVHGAMARGREAAVRSLIPAGTKGGHGPKCPCCH